MSGRNMNLDVMVRLRDQLSGPLRRLKNQLKSIADFGRKFSILGAAIAAISFMGPIKEAAAFQQKLLDIAGTSDLAGKKAFAFTDELRGKFEELALKTGQFSDTIAQGFGDMTAAGLDRNTIEASMFGIAKATTAVNAEFKDMSAVATSMIQTLDLPVNKLNDAMAALVVSGRLGSFELKDMAKVFPSLTSSMTQYGIKSRDAVNFLGTALQIARKGTSDPAEAANNLKNFLDKLKAPETLRNFKKANVDLEAVMSDAALKGINPVEAAIRKIADISGVSDKELAKMMRTVKDKGLEGADAMAEMQEQLKKIKGAAKLGELFGDQQVMNFLIPALGNIDEWKRINAEVSKATASLIDPAFETQMEGLNTQLRIFQELGTQAGREVGFAFGELLPDINRNLMQGITWWRDWNKETGGLGSKLLTFGGGAILAATAIGAIGFALPAVVAGFGLLAALVSPVGIAIGIIGAGAYLLYKNWDRYGPRLRRMWDGLADTFKGFKPSSLRAFAAGFAAIAGLFSKRIPGLFLLYDLFQWLDGKASVIDDLAKSLSKLTGIDAGKISNVFAGLAAAGAGMLLFGGAARSLATGLGLLAAPSAAAGVTTLATLGGLSIAGGLFALAGSAAAAAASIKLLFDAIQSDVKLNAALKEKVIPKLSDFVLGRILGQDFAPETGFALDNPLLGPQNKVTPIDPRKKLREQLKGTNSDLEDYKFQLQKQETERVKQLERLGLRNRTTPGSNDNKPTVTKGDGRTQRIELSPQKVIVESVIKVEGPGQVVSSKTKTVDTGRRIPSSDSINRGRVVGGV